MLGNADIISNHSNVGGSGGLRGCDDTTVWHSRFAPLAAHRYWHPVPPSSGVRGMDRCAMCSWRYLRFIQRSLESTVSALRGRIGVVPVLRVQICVRGRFTGGWDFWVFHVELVIDRMVGPCMASIAPL